MTRLPHPEYLAVHIAGISPEPRPRRCWGCWALFSGVALVLAVSYARYFFG